MNYKTITHLSIGVGFWLTVITLMIEYPTRPPLLIGATATVLAFVGLWSFFKI